MVARVLELTSCCSIIIIRSFMYCTVLYRRYTRNTYLRNVSIVPSHLPMYVVSCTYFFFFKNFLTLPVILRTFFSDPYFRWQSVTDRICPLKLGSLTDESTNVGMSPSLYFNNYPNMLNNYQLRQNKLCAVRERQSKGPSLHRTAAELSPYL